MGSREESNRPEPQQYRQERRKSRWDQRPEIDRRESVHENSDTDPRTSTYQYPAGERRNSDYGYPDRDRRDREYDHSDRDRRDRDYERSDRDRRDGDYERSDRDRRDRDYERSDGGRRNSNYEYLEKDRCDSGYEHPDRTSGRYDSYKPPRPQFPRPEPSRPDIDAGNGRPESSHHKDPRRYYSRNLNSPSEVASVANGANAAFETVGIKEPESAAADPAPPASLHSHPPMDPRIAARKSPPHAGASGPGGHDANSAARQLDSKPASDLCAALQLCLTGEQQISQVNNDISKVAQQAQRRKDDLGIIYKRPEELEEALRNNEDFAEAARAQSRHQSNLRAHHNQRNTYLTIVVGCFSDLVKSEVSKSTEKQDQDSGPLQDILGRLQQLEGQCSSLQAENKDLKSEMESLRAERSNDSLVADATSAKTEKLRSDFDTAHATSSELRTDLNSHVESAKESIQRIWDEVTATSGSLLTQTKDVKSAKESIQRVWDEVIATSGSLITLTKDFESAKESIQRIQGEVTATSGLLITQTKDVESAKESIQRIQDEVKATSGLLATQTKDEIFELVIDSVKQIKEDSNRDIAESETRLKNDFSRDISDAAEQTRREHSGAVVAARLKILAEFSSEDSGLKEKVMELVRAPAEKITQMQQEQQKLRIDFDTAAQSLNNIPVGQIPSLHSSVQDRLCKLESDNQRHVANIEDLYAKQAYQAALLDSHGQKISSNSAQLSEVQRLWLIRYNFNQSLRPNVISPQGAASGQPRPHPPQNPAISPSVQPAVLTSPPIRQVSGVSHLHPGSEPGAGPTRDAAPSSSPQTRTPVWVAVGAPQQPHIGLHAPGSRLNSEPSPSELLSMVNAHSARLNSLNVDDLQRSILQKVRETYQPPLEVIRQLEQLKPLPDSVKLIDQRLQEFCQKLDALTTGGLRDTAAEAHKAGRAVASLAGTIQLEFRNATNLADALPDHIRTIDKTATQDRVAMLWRKGNTIALAGQPSPPYASKHEEQIALLNELKHSTYQLSKAHLEHTNVCLHQIQERLNRLEPLQHGAVARLEKVEALLANLEKYDHLLMLNTYHSLEAKVNNLQGTVDSLSSKGGSLKRPRGKSSVTQAGASSDEGADARVDEVKEYVKGEIVKFGTSLLENKQDFERRLVKAEDAIQAAVLPAIKQEFDLLETHTDWAALKIAEHGAAIAIARGDMALTQERVRTIEHMQATMQGVRAGKTRLVYSNGVSEDDFRGGVEPRRSKKRRRAERAVSPVSLYGD